MLLILVGFYRFNIFSSFSVLNIYLFVRWFVNIYRPALGLELESDLWRERTLHFTGDSNPSTYTCVYKDNDRTFCKSGERF